MYCKPRIEPSARLHRTVVRIVRLVVRFIALITHIMPNNLFALTGGEKRAPVNKRNKNTKKEEAPQILDETFQRLESYSKSVKSLFHAVSYHAGEHLA